MKPEPEKLLCGQHGQKHGHASTSSIKSIKSTYPEIAANGALALIAVACSLLDRQMASLEKTFLAEGGFSERLYRMRTQRRSGG